MSIVAFNVFSSSEPINSSVMESASCCCKYGHSAQKTVLCSTSAMIELMVLTVSLIIEQYDTALCLKRSNIISNASIM